MNYKNNKEWHDYCLAALRDIKKQMTPSTDEMLEELSKLGSIKFEIYFLETIRKFINQKLSTEGEKNGIINRIDVRDK